MLILTKPLGNGIINTAVKAELATPESIRAAQEAMTQLNSKAKTILERYPVHACTDVTGFGLVGHGIEMAEASQVTFMIKANEMQCLPGVLDYARLGLIPAGAYKNRKYFGEKADISGCKEAYADVLFDPQTSGGLLASVAKESAFQILEEFAREGVGSFVSIIGYVTEKENKNMIIT